MSTESRIYIGANNETNKMDVPIVLNWANNVLKDYTYHTARGGCGGKFERCAVLVHVGKPINETHLLELKGATNQDCILVTESQVKVREI